MVSFRLVPCLAVGVGTGVKVAAKVIERTVDVVAPGSRPASH